MKKNRLIYIILIFIFIFSGCSGKRVSQNAASTKDIGVSEGNKSLQYFKETHKENKVIKCGEGDVDGDGRKDLVVIFNVGKDKNNMVVVLDKESQYKLSNTIPAPISNQKIEFKNIDEKTPMEFIVSGSKGSSFGYGIYRLENMKIVDLFGEGMKDCC